MGRRVIIEPPAQTDIDDVAEFLARDDPAAAHRFLSASDAAMVRLAEFPRMGRRRSFTRPILACLRTWPIPGFPKVLIYYRLLGDALDVVRVLHGARDAEGLIEDEDPPPLPGRARGRGGQTSV